MGTILGITAIISLFVKAIAVATGRDFLFGIIPAFDPGGSRNLVTWGSSMLLAACGGLAALVAGTHRLRTDSSARGWRLLAGTMGVLSLVWMTGLARRLFDSIAVPLPPDWVALGGAVAAMLALRATRQASRPSIVVVALPTALLLLLSGRAMGRPGAAAAVADMANRVLEWFAIAFVADTCVRLLAARAPAIALSVRRDGRRPVRLRGSDAGINILVCPSAVKRWSTVAIVLLLAVSLASAWLAHSYVSIAEPWHRFLFVDFEGNLPTWFSAILLLTAGLVAAIVSVAERSRRGVSWWHWALMALGFVALSADEAASLHELLVTPLRALVGGTSWLRYPLIIPGTAVAGAAVLVFGRFVQRLPADTRRAIVSGGAVFLFGVLVLETVGGWYDPVLYGASLPYVLLATAEEACEMTGVTIVLVGLLRFIEQHVGVIDIHVIDDLPHR